MNLYILIFCWYLVCTILVYDTLFHGKDFGTYALLMYTTGEIECRSLGRSTLMYYLPVFRVLSALAVGLASCLILKNDYCN